MDYLSRRFFSLKSRFDDFIDRLGTVEFALLNAALLSISLFGVYQLYLKATEASTPSQVQVINLGLITVLIIIVCFVLLGLRPLPEATPVTPAVPFRERLEQHLWKVIADINRTPPPYILEKIIDVGERMYSSVVLTPPTTDEERLKAERAPQRVFDAIAKSLTAYLRKLPRIQEGQLSLPFYEMADSYLIFDMIEPLRAVEDLGVLQSVPNSVHYAAISVTKKQGGEFAWPQYFKGSQKDMVQTYLGGTVIEPLFTMSIPWRLTNKQMSMHHWCLGGPGSGKTTFLSHLISGHLRDVAENKCSLVVIDSQRLVRHMSHCLMFAKGEPLGDRLIIVDPHSEYAPALNPFHMKSEQGKQGDVNAIVDFITYAATSQDGETSQPMKDTLRAIVRATSHLQYPNIKAMLDFFKPVPPRQAWKFPHPHIYHKLDPQTRDYFDNTFPGMNASTKQAVHTRLANLAGQESVARMLNANSFTLDLFDELHEGGKILLVDTDYNYLKEDGCRQFGQVFVALLDHLASRRGKFDDNDKLKPIFVVIDEAHDVLSNDNRFAQVLVKTRNKRVWLTVAHHNPKQLDNPKIREGLEMAYVKSRCTTTVHDVPGPVHIEVGREPTIRAFDIPIDRLEWTDKPQMSTYQYTEMRESIYERFKDTGSQQPKIEMDEPTFDRA